MIKLHAEASALTVTEGLDDTALVSTMANVASVQVTFSEDWAGLDRVLVFTDGNRTIIHELTEEDEIVPIPHELMAEPGQTLYIGVQGTDGERVILPTVMCRLKAVAWGANPDGDKTTIPSKAHWMDVRDELERLAGEAAASESAAAESAEAAQEAEAAAEDSANQAMDTAQTVTHDAITEWLAENPGALSDAVIAAKLTKYATVADMQADEGLAAGQIVMTVGYHTAMDGGGNAYYIAADPVEGESCVQLADSALYGQRYAVLIRRGAMTPEQYGAAGDGVTDDTAAFQAALDRNTKVFAPKVYRVSRITVYHGALEIGGEVRGQVKIENQATVRGGVIVGRAGESAVLFENHGGELNAMDSILSDCRVRSEAVSASGVESVGVELYTHAAKKIPEKINPSTGDWVYVDKYAMHNVTIKNIVIEDTSRALYFHNDQSWLTKSAIENIFCNRVDYVIYVYNDRSTHTPGHIYGAGYYGDLVLRNVYSQYAIGRPKNFVRVAYGSIEMTMYDCLNYDGIGECLYYLSPDEGTIGNTAFTMLGTIGNNPYGAPGREYVFTNLDNLSNFLFSTHAGTRDVTTRIEPNKHSRVNLTRKDQADVSFFQQISGTGPRFSGIVTRGGTRGGAQYPNTYYGLSWDNGILMLLRNVNEANVVDTAEYPASYYKVATPYSGNAYADYAALPTEAKDGATCWVASIRGPVTKNGSLWYHADGTPIQAADEQAGLPASYRRYRAILPAAEYENGGYFIRDTGVWQKSGSSQSWTIPVPENAKRWQVLTRGTGDNYVAFLTARDTPAAGQTPSYCDGYEGRIKAVTGANEWVLPTDCRYVYINTTTSTGTDISPIAMQYVIDVWETGQAEIDIPDPPAEDGAYTLRATVTGGTVTYTWVPVTAET